MIFRGPNSTVLKRIHTCHAQSTPTKRREVAVPRKFVDLIQHSSDWYDLTERLYLCSFSPTFSRHFLRKNAVPNQEKQAFVPLVPTIPMRAIACEELRAMSDMSDWPEDIPKPVLSNELITNFLARVHSFTAVGLEAQAYAYSVGSDGVINNLVLLPQINKVSTVEDGDNSLAALNALQMMEKQDPAHAGEFKMRCWIHTHPRFKAYMSSLDLYTLHTLTRQNPNFFGIVLSPRGIGLKALIVCLTREGIEEINRFKRDNSEEDVISLIHDSSTKLYCQVPFNVLPEPCHVFDLRSEEEVTSQLVNFINSGQPVDNWVPRTRR